MPEGKADSEIIKERKALENNMTTNPSRRKLFKVFGITLAAAPLLVASKHALATKNLDIRAKLKYQDSPQDFMNCLNCLEFLPGRSDLDFGRCRKIPGDTEIAPNGYCIAWVGI